MHATRLNPMVILWLVAALGPLAGTGAIHAQAPATRDVAPRLQLYAYSLRHQPARDAFDVVQRMLSPDGRITLRPESRTLEVRDRSGVVRQIANFLRDFDHPQRILQLEVMVIHAFTLPVSPQPADSPEIPKALTAKWRDLLSFQSYQLLARAELEPRENEEVTYEMADGYRVSFRVGTLLDNRRIKLHGLRLSQVPGRGRSEKVLIHSTLTPWIGQPLTLGISRSDKSERDRSGLMLVVICRSSRPWVDGALDRALASDGNRSGGSP